MNYYNNQLQDHDDIRDRYDTAMERIAEIATEDVVAENYRKYFAYMADVFANVNDALDATINGDEASFKNIIEKAYAPIKPENYNTSFANPDLCVGAFPDKQIAQMLAFLSYEIHGLITSAFEGKILDITLWAELLLEVYGIICDGGNAKSVHDAIYYFEHDYAEYFVTARTAEKLDPALAFATDIIMESDLSDTSYLYKYGEYIGENELRTAAHLNSMSQEEIDAMARTYTEGFRLGFVAAGIDMTKKKNVNIRYSIGMERMVRAAICQFRDMGLAPVCYRYDTNRINKSGIRRIGYVGTPVNKQMDYDHRMDNALFTDKKLMERKLEVVKQAYEKYAYEASVYAGPAVIEIFGEAPFAPENKDSACKLSDKQQQLNINFANESTQVVNEYIPGDEYSFTIIAYPMPEIGENYEEIFSEIVKINTLDNDTYRPIQQTIIDQLDKAEFVRVVGKGANATDMTVAMHVLENPEKETNFENCVADVNIPLGEVFTSPKLTGTHGVLNVSQVYLNDLKYVNLKLTFEDGKIANYTCDNFETEEENAAYIKDNLLNGRDTLPIGEFAIGTNTTAYVIANAHNMVHLLPILIVEKMGPHFAVGDTCYSWSEENRLYNPDGKEIVAKDNECSILRKTDISKAYFNCHTDITIPYDEIGAIYTIHHDGTEVAIIKDGRFVLPGTEYLNEPFKD